MKTVSAFQLLSNNLSLRERRNMETQTYRGGGEREEGRTGEDEGESERGRREGGGEEEQRAEGREGFQLQLARAKPSCCCSGKSGGVA